jgi:hypothetical protein
MWEQLQKTKESIFEKILKTRKSLRLPRNTTVQPSYTYKGAPIVPYTLGLPKLIESICPECNDIILARQFEENGDVYVEKVCERHGVFKDYIYRDAKLYLKMEEITFGDGRGLKNTLTSAKNECPYDCGLCPRHTSHTSLAVIDLTNRCNLTCPYCFAHANSAGFLYEVSLDQIKLMLQTLRDEQPVSCRSVQFSGGEPTIHPNFLEIVRIAKKMGFTQIQIATNGIKFQDPEFTQAAKEAGVDTLYLQLDGTSDEVYTKIRGRKLNEIKLKVLENVRKTDYLKIVLVPTIIRGINDKEVGNIVRLGIENVDIITGISFQPVCITGRIKEKNRLKERYTLGDLAYDVKEQANIGEPRRDWFPLSCITPFQKLNSALRGEPTLTVTCHPHCSIGIYLFVDPQGKAHPITNFLDVQGLLRDIDKLSRKVEKDGTQILSKATTLFSLRRRFKQRKAPEGLTFEKVLKVLDGYQDRSLSRGKKVQKTRYPALFIAGMHFQDGFNFNLERVRRCTIHYAAPNGRIYPFCTYNSGPTFRKKIEKTFCLPEEEVLKLYEREGKPPELKRLKEQIEKKKRNQTH